MKNLYLAFLFSPCLLFSQEFSFEVDYIKGFIEKTYLLDDNKIFNISETIDEIYIFSSDSIAKQYLITLDQSIKPKKKLNVGETTMFLDAATSIEYYKNNTLSGSIGQIKSINNIAFTYAPENSYNSNAGIVGKLTKIGNIKITYWTDAGYTEKGKYRGKIKSFGDKQFKYEGWSSWGEKAGMVGKITSIGSIKINYYDTDYDIGFKGKLKSIGAVQFIYFGDTFNNKKANIVGKFKQQTGQDSRIVIQ